MHLYIKILRNIINAITHYYTEDPSLFIYTYNYVIIIIIFRLRFLSWVFLNRKIQISEGGHDSIEDSLAAASLFMLFIDLTKAGTGKWI